MKIEVLVACEFSGVVRQAFRKRGINAWSCDLLPAEDGSRYHIQGDVFRELKKITGLRLLIAHPPCTFLCNSGVKHLYRGGKFSGGKNPRRWREMRAGANFFKKLMELPVPMIAVENPIMHRYAKKIIGARQTQIVQPWQFGHGEIKATCWWLKYLPPLKPTRIVSGRIPRVHHASPGDLRWMERSRTLPGLARAMAVQWGALLRPA